MEERSLKKEGEDLAKVAVESGLGSKQLQTIYRLTRKGLWPM
jgi:lambda repressor-like predicted transcriptional regulator